ncbi:mannitol-1-phosphate 5-dehydrogenase, partial [Streptococcus pneumoniae]|nr:mannitol-1-phosphate 5-dehydrogenase [Streptococcus pneumoniae]
MKHSVHFGAGNIGRGFIGEILFKNGFHIDFVDVNNQIIHALNEKGKYEIEIAQKGQSRIEVTNVAGINSKEHPEQVIEAIQKTDIITTAIGPNIL